MKRIQKQRNIIDFALSSLLRRWKKNLALLAVYIFVVFILTSVFFFTEAIKREAALVLQGAPEVIVQRLVAGRQVFVSEEYMAKLKKITGVSSVKGRLWAYYYVPFTGANYTLIVPERSDLREGTIAIGRGVARTLDIAKGDTVPFTAFDGTYLNFEVSDIFTAESELVSSDLIQISERDFRSLFGIPQGFYTDITLGVRNSKELGVVGAKIAKLFPDTRPILRDEILRTYDALFQWRSGLLLVIFVGALAAFIIFAWDKATSLSSEERSEIGVLKAVGWETSEVIQLKAWEGIVVSLTAFFSGVLLAYFHVFLTSGFLFQPVLKGWAVLYPQFQPVPFVDVYQLAVVFLLTVFPYTVATIIPSWSAATIDPDSIMRL